MNDIKKIARLERSLSSQLLYHLREIERRKLFSDLGYSSLHEYVVRELKYSEGAATRRIRSSRLLEQIPEIGPKLAEGKLSLTNLSLASGFFKDEDITDKKIKTEILQKIENKSSRECEKILFSLGEAPPIPKEKTKIISKDMLAFTMNITEDTLKLFTEAKNLSYAKTNDEFLNILSREAIDRYQRKKFHLTNSNNTSSSNPRYVTAAVKKEVYRAGHGKCQICSTTMNLQYDHIRPFSLGGKTEKANLRLLCFSCNQRSRIRANL